MNIQIRSCTYCEKRVEFLRTTGQKCPLRHCSRCTNVWYCDETCQEKDWPRHKPHCKAEYAGLHKKLHDFEYYVYGHKWVREDMFNKFQAMKKECGKGVLYVTFERDDLVQLVKDLPTNKLTKFPREYGFVGLDSASAVFHDVKDLHRNNDMDKGFILLTEIKSTPVFSIVYLKVKSNEPRVAISVVQKGETLKETRKNEVRAIRSAMQMKGLTDEQINTLASAEFDEYIQTGEFVYFEIPDEDGQPFVFFLGVTDDLMEQTLQARKASGK